MKFFSVHLGNTAGVAWNLTQGLSGIGRRSCAVELEPQAQRFPADFSIHMTPETGRIVRMGHFARIARLARSSELVHFHFGIRPFARYLRKVCRAPFFVHYHGSDLREGEADGFREMAEGEFIATPDLRAWSPSAVWIPNPVRVPNFGDTKRRATPVVGHFPTNPLRKGTERILAAIRDLEDQADFRFLLVAGETHDVALKKMAECDIVIDQLTGYGAYGNVAVEGMLMGKVVLSSVKPALYDRCPVIPITATDIETQLLSVLQSPDRWEEIGKAGVEYATATHDPSRVAKKLVEAYASRM